MSITFKYKKMKNLFVIILLSVGFMMNAQNPKKGKMEARKEIRENRSDYSPQQIAELQTKKMTLELDLSEKQQKDVNAINIEIATKRKAFAENRKDRKKLTDTERFELRSTMLDEKIALKAQMKNILNDDQYSKWEKKTAMKRLAPKKRHQRAKQ